MDDLTRLVGKLEGEVEQIQETLTAIGMDIANLKVLTAACLEDRRGLRRDLDIITKDQKDTCGKCLTQKIVYGVIAVIGVAVIGAILALVIKGAKI